MVEIISLLFPFFGLILIGYGAGRLRFVSADGLAGIDFLVFYIALPVLFFHLIASAPLTGFSWAFIATTTFATYCAFAIAFSIGALVNGGNVPEATIQGLVGSYSNIGYLGPALVLAAFGSAAAVPTALIFAFDNAMLFTLTPLMMALGGTMRTEPRKLAENIARQVFLHPFIIATVLGLLFATSGIPIPGPIDALLAFLANAAAPIALFAIGVGLSLRPVGKVPVDMPVLLAVKLVGHPLIVYLLLGWVGGFNPVWVSTAILLAALPPAANVLTLARHYRIYGDHASTAILLGTAASFVTLTITLVLVMNNVLPANPFR
jgi:malonate transporter